LGLAYLVDLHGVVVGTCVGVVVVRRITVSKCEKLLNKKRRG
jgi:hypothetical protein